MRVFAIWLSLLVGSTLADISYLINDKDTMWYRLKTLKTLDDLGAQGALIEASTNVRHLGYADAPTANEVNNILMIHHYSDTACSNLWAISQTNCGLCEVLTNDYDYVLRDIELASSTSITVGTWRYTDNMCASPELTSGINNYTTRSYTIDECVIDNGSSYIMSYYTPHSTSNTGWRSDRDFDGYMLSKYNSNSYCTSNYAYYRAYYVANTECMPFVNPTSSALMGTCESGTGLAFDYYNPSNTCSGTTTAATFSIDSCEQDSSRSDIYTTSSCYTAPTNDDNDFWNTLHIVLVTLGAAIFIVAWGAFLTHYYKQKKRHRRLRKVEAEDAPDEQEHIVDNQKDVELAGAKDHTRHATPVDKEKDKKHKKHKKVKPLLAETI
jgi:hypothetical protein